MATQWISPTWRMPENSNQSKVDNYSLEFDSGSSQKIDATIPSLDNATALTFAGWFKKSAGNVIGFESFNASTDRAILYWWSDNNVYWSVRNGSASTAASSSLTTYDWNHIAGTFDGATNTIKLYVNGSLVDTQTGQPSSTSANLDTNFHIGLSNGTTYNDGSISQPCVYNEALTADQITALYNSGTPVNPMALSSLPTAYYPLGGSSTGSASTLTTPNDSVPSATVFDFDDAASQFVILPQNANTIGNAAGYTFSGWFNPSDLSGATVYRTIYASDYDQGVIIWLYGSAFYCYHRYSGWKTVLVSALDAALAVGEWFHFAFSWDGSDKIKAYLNGVLKGETSGVAGIDNPPPYYTANYPSIGNYNNFIFDGQISNFQIYDTNLTDGSVSVGSPATGQIAELYNNGVPPSTAVASSNLKAWYKLNVDTSTWDGTNWIIGEAQANYTTALNFDGALIDGININNDSSLEPLTSFTLSCWIKSETSQNSYAYPVYKESSDSNHVAYGFYLQGSQTIATTVTTSGVITSDSIGDLRDDKWHHVVQTYDGSGMKVYLDGVQSGATKSITGNVDYSTTQTELYIGNTRRTSPSGYFSFKGEISNVALFNSAIDAAGVSTLFNSGTPQTSISFSPTSLWKLDNTTTGIQDSVGSNNGTITGSVAQVDSFVSTLNGTSSGMTTANLVTSDLTRSIPYSSYSMVFDGIADEIALTSNFVAAGEFTLSLWINPDNVVDNNFLGNGSSSSNWLQIKTASQLKVKVLSTVLVFNESGGNDLTASAWNHVLIYRDASNDVGVYVNGQTFGSTNNNTSTLTLSTIGRATGIFFEGNISNTAFWSSSLTEDQVLTIYNGGVPNDISSLSPVSWWSLAGDSYFDGTDWICPDLGSASNDGTSNGMGGTELVGDGPGSTANGVATSMDIPANLKGDAPNSTSNAFSINMTAIDRVTSVPG